MLKLGEKNLHFLSYILNLFIRAKWLRKALKTFNESIFLYQLR